VEVREVDINFSEWDNKLETRSGKYCPLRLGLRQVKGLREEDVKLLILGRTKNYSSINELRDIGIT
jgi:error-prone DNA polymerase